MRRLLKRIGIALGGLVGLIIVAGAVLYTLGTSRLYKLHDIQAEPITVPTDEAAVARGQHLVEAVTFCQACHGEDLGGDMFDDEPGIATIPAPNLTSGLGGSGSSYSDDDYVRAIRHGVNAQGRGLIIMHSDVYHNLRQEDLGAIIAYIKSLPPVDNELPETNVAPLGRIFVALGMFDSEAIPLIPAEVIDHDAPLEQAPPEGPTAEYGAYLMSITLCRMCHGEDLKGGEPLEPGMPPGPSLSPDSEVGEWSEADFIRAMRTGITPHGHMLDPEIMPWDVYTKMTDAELKALWLYLRSLPAREASS